MFIIFSKAHYRKEFAIKNKSPSHTLAKGDRPTRKEKKKATHSRRRNQQPSHSPERSHTMLSDLLFFFYQILSYVSIDFGDSERVSSLSQEP